MNIPLVRFDLSAARYAFHMYQAMLDREERHPELRGNVRWVERRNDWRKRLSEQYDLGELA